MQELQGKRVLFIGIGFYDYEKSIQQKLSKLGAEVSFYTDEPKNLIFKVKKELLNIYDLSRHHNRILSELVRSGIGYDFVFIIKGGNLTEDFLLRLRKILPKTTLINYQWDSLNRVNGGVDKIKYFDKVFSFDRSDCEQYGLIFRPLFFRDEIIKTKDLNLPAKYLMFFVGLYQEDRKEIIEKILCDAPNGERCSFIKIFANGISLLKKPTLFMHKKIIFKRINYTNVIKKMAKSEVIIDLPHSLQSGLTIRTIEAVGLQKKIITTNKDIFNYDFYNESNVYVLDVKNYNPQGLEEFLYNSRYVPIETQVVEKYSIESWIKDILC